jgi:hypothetical protein
VKLAFLGPPALVPHYKAGTLKLLAQSASRRALTLQEVPTLEDAGCERCAERREVARHVQHRRGRTDRQHTEEIGKLARADSVKYARLVKELSIKTN